MCEKGVVVVDAPLPDPLSVADVVSRVGHLSPAVAAAICHATLDLLEGARGARRAIAADTVLVSPSADGRCRVSLLGEDAGRAPTSPEDVEDVGRLLYFMLHGRLPDAPIEATRSASRSDARDAEPTLGTGTAATASGSLMNVVAWAIAPTETPKTHGELRRRLEDLGFPRGVDLLFADLVPARAASPDDRVDATIGGIYRLLRVIGRGGMGTVYEAAILDRGEPAPRVALKLLETSGAEADVVGSEHDRRAHRRLARELRAFARIEHPNVTAALDIGFDERTGVAYVVMELLQGTDLASRVRTAGPLRWEEAVDLVAQAARGLGAIHRAGLVHRDVKPANLFLHRPEHAGEIVVKVCDFGLVRSHEASTPPSETRSGALLGSPAYISPEQLRDPRRADPRSDVWSLGVSLYFALSGRIPWRATGAGPILAAIARGDALPLLDVAPRVPTTLASIVETAMAASPSERFSSADALANALEAAARGGPARRSRVGLVGLAGAVAALGAATLALAWPRGGAHSPLATSGGGSAPVDPPACEIPPHVLDYRVDGLSLRTLRERIEATGFVCARWARFSPDFGMVRFDRPQGTCSFTVLYGAPKQVAAFGRDRRPDRADAESAFSLYLPACAQRPDVEALVAAPDP